VCFQVAELKRINNLIQDQDFYALTSVKIPVKKHSFLIDQIKEDDQKVNTQHETEIMNGACYLESADESELHYDSEPTTDLSDPENQKDVIRKISINRTSRGQSREAQNFLRKMDQDLSNIVKSSRTDRASLDEVISVLTNKSVSPMFPREKPKSFYEVQCHGKWKYYIVLAIVLCVALPILFGITLYYKGKLW